MFRLQVSVIGIEPVVEQTAIFHEYFHWLTKEGHIGRDLENLLPVRSLIRDFAVHL